VPGRPFLSMTHRHYRLVIRGLGIALLAGVVAVPLIRQSAYLSTLGSQIGIHAIIAVGLGLLLGYAGQVSLGHAAFYGLGAYASAILTTSLNWPPLAAMVVGMLMTGLIALLVGAPALRLHGHYLAMFTLGLGIIVQIVLEQAENLTNGFDGITGIPPFHLWVIHFDTDIKSYLLIVIVLAAAIAMAYNLVNSRSGRALRALHESEEAARACGVDVSRAKLEVFVVSAMLASVAGSLYAHSLGFVSPDPFGFRFSVQLVVMVIVGGASSVWGPVAGAALFTVLAQFLQQVGEKVPYVDDLDTVLFGAILVLVVVFWQRGLVSLQWPRRLRPTAAAADDGGS
jgi:branched-chain amino acid transport system permease protein